MKKTVLIVTKDVMSFLHLEPLARALKDTGLTVLIAAEGLSIKKWKDAGYSLIWEGPEKPQPADTIDAAGILELRKPDAIIIGLGSPIHAEEAFALTANEKKIPVIAFSDTWGATSRTTAKLDGILVIDQHDSEIAQARFESATTTLVGDWVNEPVKDPMHPWSGHKKTLFVAGQNPTTISDFVELAVRAMRRPADWQVVLSAHNKYAVAPEFTSARQRVASSGAEILSAEGFDQKHLAASADVTVSGFSSLLKVAALNDRVAVTVSTPNCIRQMTSSTGLDYYPLSRMGCCHILTADRPILEDLFGDRYKGAREEAAEHYRRSIAPNMPAAVEAVLGLWKE